MNVLGEHFLNKMKTIKIKNLLILSKENVLFLALRKHILFLFEDEDYLLHVTKIILITLLILFLLQMIVVSYLNYNF